MGKSSINGHFQWLCNKLPEGKLAWRPTFGFTSGSWIWVEQILIWPGPGGGIEPIEPIHKNESAAFGEIILNVRTVQVGDLF